MSESESTGDVSAADLSQTRLVGRDPNLAVLGAALARAAAGTPRVVMIEAEPGMGKTALLEEFVRSEGGGAKCFRATCDPYEQEVPFGALSMILEDLPPADASPIAAGTQLLRLLGDAQQRNDVVVVVIDDAHWLDSPSSAAIRFALRRLRVDRVLAVVARRPTVGADLWAGLLDDRHLASSMSLSPLSVAEIAVLVREEREWEVDSATATQLKRHTGGVPLLLRTFLVGASENEVFRPGRDLPVPSSSAAAVAQVLHTLDSDASKVLQALAVLDEPTALVPLASVADVEDFTLALAAALRTRLVEVDARDEPPLVRFTHNLLRVAVYDGMRRGLRREMHRRAASLSGGARSLGHRVAAADRPDAALAATLRTAAAEDAREGRDIQAATRLLQARAVTAEPVARDELLLRALIHRVRAEDIKAAESLRLNAEECPPSALRSYALGLLLRDTGEMTEAAAILDDALARADAAGDRELAELISLDLGTLHITLNRAAETIAAVSRSVDATDPWVARTARWHKALGLWAGGDLPAALALLEAVPSGARAAPEDADTLSVRGSLRLGAGDLEGAQADLDSVIAMTSSTRRSMNVNHDILQRGIVKFYRGRWDEAAIDASKACALADAGDIPWDSPTAHAAAAQVPAGRGEWDAAEDHLRMARAATPQVSAVTLTGLTAARMFLGVTREDWEAVIAEAEPQMSTVMTVATQTSRVQRWFFVAAVTALVRVGRLEDAGQLLTHYVRTGAGAAVGAGLGRVGWLRGILAEAQGDANTAKASYASDLADPKIDAVPLAKAVLLHSAGHLERALGNRREAVDYLRPARDILVRLRATPYLERCDADLAACGLHPVASNPLALTPREQDVATLVARGLTNADTAAELFVTVKTVEYHLMNVFSKLGIASRRELRSVLAA